jgi:hypothetical protein
MARDEKDARVTAALRRLRALTSAAVAVRHLGGRVRAVAARIGEVASVVVSDSRLVLRRPVREAILVAASVAFIIWVFKLLNDSFLYADLGFDEQVFVWGGWALKKGLIPYRDFLEYKPPMVFVTHALALALHGFKDLRFRWFFMYWPLASLLALYAAMLSRKIDKVCALALILAIMQLFMNHAFHDTALTDTESIGLTYYFFGVAALIARSRFDAYLKAIGVAMLVCCAFSKEPYMPVAFSTWIACFFLDAPRTGRGRAALRYLKLSLIGGGAILVGLSLYLGPTGGLSAYVRMVRSYARIYTDPKKSFCVMFGRFVPKGDAVEDLHSQWELVRTDFFNLAVLGYLLPFGALFAFFVPRKSILLALTSLIALASALYATAMSKCAWSHYYVMAMAGLFFCLVAGLDGMTSRVPSATAPRLAGWLLFAAMFALIWPRIDEERERRVPRPHPNAYADSVPGSLEFIKKHTVPGDRIFTTGAPGIYVQADRVGATRECAHFDELIYGYPGNTDEERLSGIRAQLEKNMPKVVIFDPMYDEHRALHKSLVFMPFLKAHGYKQHGDHFWLRPN